MPLYHLHPVSIHFPIALLTLGLAAEFLSTALKDEKWQWLISAAEWLLWVGTLSAWVSVGLGLLAEETAPHVPPAWEILEDHETLGFWTAGLFTAFSMVRFFFRKEWRSLAKNRRRIYIISWVFLCGLLFSTAYFGGRLVYNFGMGVVNNSIK